MLTGTGQGKDAERLDDKDRTRLRKQALDWLRANLAAHEKQLENGNPDDRTFAGKRLKHWQTDPDLTAIRDPEALAKLPTEERQACQQLWADVRTLLKKAHAMKK